MSDRPAADSSRLEARGIGKQFGGVIALNNVDFDIRDGEVHALCGENGAGKSTLIKILSGVHPFGSYRGTIRVDGRVARFHSPRNSAHAGIAVIHQELALIEGLSIAENLFLGDLPRRGVRVELAARVTRVRRASTTVWCGPRPGATGRDARRRAEAAGRDPQGGSQELAGADPRRADRGPGRNRGEAPARPGATARPRWGRLRLHHAPTGGGAGRRRSGDCASRRTERRMVLDRRRRGERVDRRDGRPARGRGRSPAFRRRAN